MVLNLSCYAFYSEETPGWRSSCQRWLTFHVSDLVPTCTCVMYPGITNSTALGRWFVFLSSPWFIGALWAQGTGSLFPWGLTKCLAHSRCSLKQLGSGCHGVWVCDVERRQSAFSRLHPSVIRPVIWLFMLGVRKESVLLRRPRLSQSGVIQRCWLSSIMLRRQGGCWQVPCVNCKGTGVVWASGIQLPLRRCLRDEVILAPLGLMHSSFVCRGHCFRLKFLRC